MASLTEYKKKRKFDKTPEPGPTKKRTRTGRLYVIQKHRATQLHYDFRLEVDGVLKSWAVPKGPSMDPKVKRLAMQVEDHPYDYRTFEGIIPEGNYGAGTVMVWDEGTYHIAGKEFNTKKAEDAELLKEWESGKIHFVLDGTKLKGEFALVKAAWRGDKSWLLMKLKDEHATTDEILLEDKSAVTMRTLEEITSKKTSPRKAVASRKTKAK